MEETVLAGGMAPEQETALLHDAMVRGNMVTWCGFRYVPLREPDERCAELEAEVERYRSKLSEVMDIIHEADRVARS